MGTWTQARARACVKHVLRERVESYDYGPSWSSIYSLAKTVKTSINFHSRSGSKNFVFRFSILLSCFFFALSCVCPIARRDSWHAGNWRFRCDCSRHATIFLFYVAYHLLQMGTFVLNANLYLSPVRVPLERNWYGAYYTLQIPRFHFILYVFIQCTKHAPDWVL